MEVTETTNLIVEVKNSLDRLNSRVNIIKEKISEKLRNTWDNLKCIWDRIKIKEN